MADVAVLGASGYAGAIAASLIWRHPFFELKHVTARSEAGARARRDPPAHARAAAARGLGPGRAGRGRRGARVLAAPRRRRPRWPSCASAACGSSTCRPTSACATTTTYEDWYGPHGAPDLFGAARLRAARALPRGDRRAPTSSPTPAATRPRRCSALAPLARAGAIADVVIDAKSGVAGAGRSPTRDDPLHLGRREHDPVQGRAPPPHAGDRAGARGAGGDAADHVHAAPGAARAGRAGLGLRHAGDSSWARASSPSSTARPTRASRGSRSSSARPACSRCARPTTAASPSTATTAPAACSCSPRSTTCGRARRRRRCRTST